MNTRNENVQMLVSRALVPRKVISEQKTSSAGFQHKTKKIREQDNFLNFQGSQICLGVAGPNTNGWMQNHTPKSIWPERRPTHQSPPVPRARNAETAPSNLTGVSLGSCHRVTRHFFLNGQQGCLTGPIYSLVKKSPRKSNQRICLCQVKDVSSSNRADFLTDRIPATAKTTNIKKPKDLVNIQKMFDNWVGGA